MVIDDTDDSFDLESSMDSGINSSQNSGTQQIKNISLNSSQEDLASETPQIKNISMKNPKTNGNFMEPIDLEGNQIEVCTIFILFEIGLSALFLLGQKTFNTIFKIFSSVLI